MKYCSQCGSSVVMRIPEGDDRPRHTCDSCDIVHYQNPKIIVGCLPVYQDKVLLCRRAIEPRKGYWTLPAGFMEMGETMVDGATRETWEEAQAKVENHSLYRVIDVPFINQVYVFYRAELASPDFAPGPESLEVKLFMEDEIPWQEISFPSVEVTLKGFFADRINGEYPMESSVIDKSQSLKL